MAIAMARFLAKGWVSQLYVEPAFYFTYPGLGWIHPWPAGLMQAHFALLALLAMGVALGYRYRICAILFFLGFTYVELLDQTTYLNHYYLICLLSGLLAILPAHRAWSIDAWRNPRLRVDAVPAWTLNILRFQVGVVYFFAGLAKVNSDWLFKAQPLRIWLAARSDLPFFGSWLDQAWVAYTASWLGAIFDISIVFFLLWRPTRKPAYALVVIFHLTTLALFNIGMFPWIMLVAATVFFSPSWPREVFFNLNSFFSEHIKWIRITENLSHRPIAIQQQRMLVGHKTFLLTLFLGLYAAIQLALPIRSFLVARTPAWTCSGFNCAWRVMIAEKTGYTEFYAFDPATGNRWRLSTKGYLTPRQEVMMAQDPYLIREMARRMANDLKNKGEPNVKINVESFATLNGRPSQRFIAPNVDLAKAVSDGWILPLLN